MIHRLITDKPTIRQFLNALYGGRGPKGEVGFTVEDGVLFEELPKIGPSPLVNEKVRVVWLFGK